MLYVLALVPTHCGVVPPSPQATVYSNPPSGAGVESEIGATSPVNGSPAVGVNGTGVTVRVGATTVTVMFRLAFSAP
jgi:hypothetical protein